MIREAAFKEEVRKSQLIGAKIVFDTVSSTMGAKGKLVGIQNRFYKNYVTKDGFRSSQSISLKDPIQNFGASMIQEVAEKCSIYPGDGTTTATVLTYKMYEKGVECIDNGANAVGIKKGITIAVDLASKELEKNVVQLKGNDMIKQVATVSANNDENIGGIIADAMSKIKSDGTIDVDAAVGKESSLEIVDGMRFERGYIVQNFINNPERMLCELENTFILVYYGILESMEQIIPVLEVMTKTPDASLLVVALEIEQECLQTLLVNKEKGGLRVSAVRAPGEGLTRKTWLEDIAVSCGAYVISEDSKVTLSEFSREMFGNAKKIRQDDRSTTIIQGGFDKKDLESRVRTINNQIKTAKKRDNVALYKERLSRLDSGVAIISVGHTTEVELREKMDLFEDAIAATRSAVEKGVLPGGGTSLARASLVLDDYDSDNKDVQLGVEIVKDTLREPLMTIMNNAGLDGKEILNSVLHSENKNFGFDLNDEQYCDMIESGILDTLIVERTALENAASVASLMLNMDTVIYSVDEPQPQQQIEQ